jgi:hypothetical protein
MKKISMLAVCAALAGFCVSPVLADNTASSSTMSMHSAKSIECSKEADAKGLHGKARKKFRSACKHGKSDTMAPASGGSDKD